VPGKKLRYLHHGKNKPYWLKRVDSEVKELIIAMVSNDPSTRPTLKTILKNPFFSRELRC